MWGSIICTGAGLSAGVIRVTREMAEKVVRELNVCQLRHLEQPAGYVGDLVVRGIEICQTVGRERERERVEGGGMSKQSWRW